MAYNLEISEKLDKVFYKLVKKDKLSMEIINKKILAILDNPYQFKPLRNEFAGVRRVHIGKSFVLTYEILEGEKTIRLLDYDHHDNVYRV